MTASTARQVAGLRVVIAQFVVDAPSQTSRPWPHAHRSACAFVAGLLALLPTLSQAQQLTRVVDYEYYADTGLLKLERIDPGLASCAETFYEHDAYGNRSRVTVRPCASTSPSFETRVTENLFAAKTDGGVAGNYPAGAYVTASLIKDNAGTIVKQTAAQYDPRFGAASVQTEVAIADTSKNLSKQNLYDALGRLVQETVPQRATGGAATTSAVKHEWFYCKAPAGFATVGAACITYSRAVTASYASQMLVDPASGQPTGAPVVEAIGAYYVESTPKDAGNNTVGARTRVHYDSLHREIAKESESYDGRWSMTLKAYNALGMVGASWAPYYGRDAGGAFTPPVEELIQWTAQVDLLHRPTRQRQYWRGVAGAAAAIVSAEIDYNGLESTSRVPADSSPDGVERTSKGRKNAIGKVAQTVDAYGATLTSAYDAVGNLVRTVDALGNTTTIAYTATTARFKQSLTDPNQGAWTYAHNALGELISQTDAKGQTTSLTYDVLGRLKTKTNPSLNSSWFHDKDGSGNWCAAGLNRLCETRAGNAAPYVSQITTQYDELARPRTNTFVHLGGLYSEVNYDNLGRVNTLRYPTGFTIQHGYSAAAGGRIAGVLDRVYSPANPSYLYWSIHNVSAASVFDARGQAMRTDLGGGLGTNHAFDAISGKAFNLRAGTAATSYAGMQAHRYEYDKADNVAKRFEDLNGLAETFGYDKLNRLASYQMASGVDAAANRTVTLDYNAIGNVLRKGDTGGYTYAGGRPHAVSSAAGTDYAYDANGQLTASTGHQARTLTWTAFNQPEAIQYQGRSVAFTYDENYKRIREVISAGGTTRTIDMLHPDNAGGLAFERETTSGGSIENRHYISVGGTVIAVVKTQGAGNPTPSSDPNMTLYWHKDSLGSVVGVSNRDGSSYEHMAFDPWGNRIRNSGLADHAVNPLHGDRGFTGHEQLDEVALVHMNGRIYDPAIGRFLSTDPVVGDPNDLQTYNRYSYVYNQPLRYADPDGNCPICVFAFIIGTAMAAEGNKYWSIIGRVMQLWGGMTALGGGVTLEGGLGSLGGKGLGLKTIEASFLSAFGSGMVNGDGFEQSMLSGVFAGTLSAVGGAYAKDLPKLVMAHALVGCVQGAVSGGKCGASALSAAFGKLATIHLDAHIKNPVALGVASAVAGGTASVVGGGKFANGALQAGFGYIFNELSRGITKEQAGYEVRRDRLSYFDAVDHWQTGGGVDVRVPLSSIDLSQVTDADFPKGVGQTRSIQLSGRASTAWDTQFVYGHVTLTLVAPGVVQAGYDRYNFNMQPWSSETFGRNVGTMGGGATNSIAAAARHGTFSPGRSFFIQLDGQAKIGPR
jgi:RHS repeat-associated protein